jgi:hypothetical protein
MADTKISALSASTTPLAGTEVLPIVQSGATRQVSVANLTVGRAISATSVTASTGNFVVGTAGQGINFSATPGTGTSELLNDYEEGTWTPVLKFSNGTTGITYSTQTGRYTKVGRVVSAQCQIVLSNKGSSSGSAEVYGLPFTVGYTNPATIYCSGTTFTGAFNIHVEATTDRFALQQVSVLGAVSYLSDANFSNTSRIELSVSYIV